MTEEQVAHILGFAGEAHKGQTRKGNGDPYILHPMAVANQVFFIYREIFGHEPEENLARILEAIAYLHDVVEDTDVSYEDIRLFLVKISVSEEETSIIIKGVRGMTRPNKKDYPVLEYYKAMNGYSILVKLADLWHNMSDLKPGNLLDKYQLSNYVLRNLFEERELRL